MSKHLFGMILTHQGIYANNRGEIEGNISTLQKVLQNNELYTTVSAEAIRYALREGWQEKGHNLNREVVDNRSVNFKDETFKHWPDHLDDDVLGFMHAKTETLSRRGILEITRAISITPWRGEMVQNFAQPGSNPAVTGHDPIPYAVEVHDTRYQFGFAMTPEFLGREGYAKKNLIKPREKLERVQFALEGLMSLRRVGGNHARFLTDFSPEVIVLRWTEDPAPRFLYCFREDERVGLSLKPLIDRINGGDIDPQELIIGTPLKIQELADCKGAKVLSGVKPAVQELLTRVKKDLVP